MTSSEQAAAYAEILVLVEDPNNYDLCWEILKQQVFQPMLPIYPQPPPITFTLEDNRRVRGLATAIMEVIAGCRKPYLLNGKVAPKVLEVIRNLRSPACRRLQVRKIRVQSFTQDVVEVSLTMAMGTKYRAGALRMIRTQEYWYCTNLEIGLHPTKPPIKIGDPTPPKHQTKC